MNVFTLGAVMDTLVITRSSVIILNISVLVDFSIKISENMLIAGVV